MSDVLHEVSFRVNGRPARLRVPARRTLAEALREELGLTGTHLGCEHGVCGACTILVDGAPMRGCLMLAVQAEGREIRTVEGLALPGGTLHPLQQAFTDHHALQCGYCTPGFLMLALAILEEDPDMPEAEMVERLSANLCRCTGYGSILAAVRSVAASWPRGARP